MKNKQVQDHITVLWVTSVRIISDGLKTSVKSQQLMRSFENILVFETILVKSINVSK